MRTVVVENEPDEKVNRTAIDEDRFLDRTFGEFRAPLLDLVDEPLKMSLRFEPVLGDELLGHTGEVQTDNVKNNPKIRYHGYALEEAG